VAVSLIPESISYALIAGLPPSAALQTCWISNAITALIGGRPGMITSASGLCALILHRLVNTDTVENTGIMFVPYAVAFAGVLQIVAAFFRLGRLVSNFPAPVVVGMVNAVAILALALQCRYIKVFPLSEEQIENGWEIDGEDKAVEIEWNVSLTDDLSFRSIGLTEALAHHTFSGRPFRILWKGHRVHSAVAQPYDLRGRGCGGVPD